MDFLIQQVVTRAVGRRTRSDNLFDMNYQYTRVRDMGISQQRRRIEKPARKNAAWKTSRCAWPPLPPAGPPQNRQPRRRA